LSIRNSTRTGDPVAVAVQITEDPLRTAPFEMLVEMVFADPGCVLKVAVQFLFALIVTVTATVAAEQPVPVQPTKAEPVPGAAVNVTAAPLVKFAEQFVVQLIPAGLLVMVPLPVPVLVTAKAKVCAGAAGVPQTCGVNAELPAVLNA
jgi:hypothetical protein